jgi:hypothetical protein
MPINELIRLVRTYSTPWEEKSAALKKLHDDYESKKSQLAIAIKRLQLVDEHVSEKHYHYIDRCTISVAVQAHGA